MPEKTVSNLTPAQIERLAKLTEEAGEIVQAAMKILRFGNESTYDNGIENKVHLETEIGNLYCVVEHMSLYGDLSRISILKAQKAHRDKMLANFRKQDKIICPNCNGDISQYEINGVAYTKHIMGECCIGDCG